MPKWKKPRRVAKIDSTGTPGVSLIMVICKAKKELTAHINALLKDFIFSGEAI